MRFQVKLVQMRKRGFLWWKSFYTKVKVVCETDSMESALRFAEAYPIWANENVVVSDCGRRTIFIKKGGAFFKGTALE